MYDQRYRLVGDVFRATYGWQRPTSPSPHTIMEVAPGTLPGLVTIAPELRAPVRNQGQIGRCAGETLVELFEGLALRDGKSIELSANAPYWWSRKLQGSAPDDDTGTTIAGIVTAAQVFGVPTLSAWSDDKDFSLEPDTSAVLDAAQRRGLLAFALPTVAAIKASIRDGFAVAIGFSCPDDMFSDETLASGDIDFFADDSHYKGDGHAVSIVEADDAYTIHDCTGAFLINVHWGTDVGLNGYMHLPYQYLTSGRATDAHTIRLIQGL